MGEESLRLQGLFSAGEGFFCVCRIYKFSSNLFSCLPSCWVPGLSSLTEQPHTGLGVVCSEVAIRERHLFHDETRGLGIKKYRQEVRRILNLSHAQARFNFALRELVSQDAALAMVHSSRNFSR